MAVMTCSWKHTPAPEKEVRELANAVGCSTALASVLWKRGIRDAASAGAFIAPKLAHLSDPFLLPGAREAAELLQSTLDGNKRITIFSDYDVDGLTSCALLCRCLKAHGGRVETFLPDRMTEGYGLSRKAMDRCVKETSPEMLVVLDCGTNSASEVGHARREGISVIVVDHHEPEAPAQPNVLINPKIQDSKFKVQNLENLCTVGLVFKLCHAFLKLHSGGGRRFVLKDHLDLAALGTVADLVPLLGENRILTRHGLHQMGRSKNAGLRSLMRVSGVQAEPTTFDCGFRLGPRLNAAGRLESASAALELLLTEDESRAGLIATQLDGINRERRSLQESIYEEADSMARLQFAREGGVLVVAKEGWHPGVVGIVASKLSQKFHRPAFVIALDEKDGIGKGSGRSIEGFHLVEALNGAREIIVAGGGHTMAVGVTIEASRIREFHAFLNDWAKRTADPSVWQRSLHVDLELALDSINMALAEELEMLAPFGQGNPPVLIALRGIRVGKQRRVGDGQRHLALVLEKDQRQLRSIFFQFDERPDPEIGTPVDVVLELRKDEYQGVVNLQGMLRDLIHVTPVDIR